MAFYRLAGRSESILCCLSKREFCSVTSMVNSIRDVGLLS